MFLRKRVVWLGLIVMSLAAACGNPESSDARRIYTKAPLERPGVFIRAEERTEMSRLGKPNLIPLTKEEQR